MAMKAVLLLLVAAVLLPSTLAWPWSQKKPLTKEEELIEWVKANGGEVGFKVGQECPTCLRGAVALQTYRKGDIFLKVPFKLGIKMKDLPYQGFAAEYARDFLDRMHNDPNFNKTYEKFLSVHPEEDGVLTPELYTDEQLELLQSPELARLITNQRTVTEQIYNGSYRNYFPLTRLVNERKASLRTFKYLSGLVGSRYFAFLERGTGKKVNYLVPVADMVNHDDDPNAERYDDGRFVLMRAIRTIKRGQAITNNYQKNVIHRPDMCLYIYGFVQAREGVVPFMAAHDLPTYSPQSPFQKTPLDDEGYYGKNGTHVTVDEARRLAKLLQGFSTTEEQDKELLAGNTLTDWRDRMVVEYRRQRKQAIAHNLKRIVAALNLTDEDVFGEEEEGAEEESTSTQIDVGTLTGSDGSSSDDSSSGIDSSAAAAGREEQQAGAAAEQDGGSEAYDDEQDEHDEL